MDEKRGKRIFTTAGAIIEKETNGQLEILLQTRWKKEGDKTYNGTLEIPGGHIEEGEDVYTALKREVKEECGLEITDIKPNDVSNATGKFDKQSYSVVPFCVNTYLGSSRINLTFVCRAKGELIKEGISDAKEPRWVSFSKLKELLNKEPESFFPLHLAALKYYVSQKEKGLI